MIYAFVALCLFGSAQADIVYQGSCPSEVKSVTSLDLSKLSGIWYGSEKWFKVDDKKNYCGTIEFSTVGNNTFKLNLTRTYQDSAKILTTENEVRIADKLKPGILEVKWSSTVSKYMWILGVDYDSFIIIYTCQNNELDGQHKLSLQIFTKHPYRSNEVLKNVAAVLKKNNVLELPTSDHIIEARCTFNV